MDVMNDNVSSIPADDVDNSNFVKKKINNFFSILIIIQSLLINSIC